MRPQWRRRPKTPPATVPSSRNLATNPRSPQLPPGHDRCGPPAMRQPPPIRWPLQVACGIARHWYRRRCRRGRPGGAGVGRTAILGIGRRISGVLRHPHGLSAGLRRPWWLTGPPPETTFAGSATSTATPQAFNARASGRSVVRAPANAGDGAQRARAYPGATSSAPAVTLADGGLTSAPGWARPSPTLRHGTRATGGSQVFRRQPETRPEPGEPACSKPCPPSPPPAQRLLFRRHCPRHRGGDEATSNGRTPGLFDREDLVTSPRDANRYCTTYRGRRSAACHRRVASPWPQQASSSTSDEHSRKVGINGGRPTVMGVHLMAEAERLRPATNIADVDFVRLPRSFLR